MNRSTPWLMAITLSPYQRRAAAFLHDMVMTAAALVICYAIRFDGAEFWAWMPRMAAVVALIVPIAALTYWFFGLYRGIWRFASIPDLTNIAKSVAILTLILPLIDFAARGVLVVPRSIVFTFPFVLLFLLGVLRVAYRIHRDRRTSARAVEGGTQVLIFGTGAEAELTIRALEMARHRALVPIGLVSFNTGHLGQRIRNVPVLGLDQDLEEIVAGCKRRGRDPRRLIVTEEALRRAPNIEQTLLRARALGLAYSKVARPLQDATDLSGDVRLAPVGIEDLLGRKAHDLDSDAIRRLIQGKRVLVTGGGGSIGLELCRQAVRLDARRLMIIELSEFNLYSALKTLEAENPGVPVDGRICDVRNRRRLKSLMESFEPDLIFHAAALKHVPLGEAQIIECVLTNVLGTRTVAEVARETGARAVVSISTDKAVAPISVIGATKRVAELVCAALDLRARGMQGETRFFSVRFGNVLGSSGSVVPLFWEQIKQGGPVTVTHPDMVRYFMTVEEAVGLIFSAAAHALETGARGGSIYALDMGEPQKIDSLARRMIRLAGFRPDEDIAIEYKGMRPGEKLSEELFSPDHPLIETGVAGVLAAAPEPIDPNRTLTTVDKLIQAALENDDAAVRQALARILPSFSSGEKAELDLPSIRPNVA